MYHPATSPSALLVDGRVPAREPGAAPGASKLANCPSGNRSKPWALLLASKYCPVIDPHGLMLKAAVPSKLPWGGVPLPASGSSNVVKEPSGRRTKPWNSAAGRVAWFGFAELCDKPLAAADYLALAERFAAVIVEGIPRLGPAERDAERRFNILIDTLYEARTLLIASAAVPPEEIYTAGDGTFEFQRTVSRLIEMQSEDYIANRPRR